MTRFNLRMLRPTLSKCLYATMLMSATWYFTQQILRLVMPHLYDIDAPEIYRKQFHSYILTKDCGRYTPDIIKTLKNVTLLTDVDSEECRSLGQRMIISERNETHTPDEHFILKYTNAMHSFFHRTKKEGGQYMLIVEDDILFVNTPARALEVLTVNTLNYFPAVPTWTCSKRGFGWLPTGTPSLWGSQCHVFDQAVVKGHADCIRNHPDTHMIGDMRIGKCSEYLGLESRRFLLTQESNLPSYMSRPGNLYIENSLPIDRELFDSLKCNSARDGRLVACLKREGP